MVQLLASLTLSPYQIRSETVPLLVKKKIIPRETNKGSIQPQRANQPLPKPVTQQRNPAKPTPVSTTRPSRYHSLSPPPLPAAESFGDDDKLCPGGDVGEPSFSLVYCTHTTGLHVLLSRTTDLLLESGSFDDNYSK